MILKRLSALLLCLACSLPLAGLAQMNTLSWSGDVPTTRAFMADLAALYERQHQGRVRLSLAGTSEALAAVAERRSHLGGSSRPARPLSPVEGRLELYPVVWDALVVIAHRDNPLRGLSLTQLRDIYTGRINRWSQVGGSDTPIHLYVHADPDAGLEYNLRELLLGDADAPVDGGRRLGNTQLLESAVEGDRNAIAVTTYSSARRLQVNILAIEGRAATASAIADGEYPLFIPLYIAVHPSGEDRREVRGFLRFATSPAARRVLRRNGVVPYEDGVALVSRQLERERFLQRALSESPPGN